MNGPQGITGGTDDLVGELNRLKAKHDKLEKEFVGLVEDDLTKLVKLFDPVIDRLEFLEQFVRIQIWAVVLFAILGFIFWVT